MSQFIEMFNGEFPMERWEECLTITNGKKYDGEYQETGTYPICGSGGIMGYGDQKLCPKNTVILGRKGNINSPIYMESDYWIVDTAFCLDVDKQKLLPKFFYYWCVLFDFTRYNKQGVLPSLTKNDLLKIEIPIPPMDLQTKFVNIQNQADKSEFDGLKSQFIEMRNHTTTTRKKVGEVAKVMTGSTPSRNHPEYWGGSNYWVAAQDMGGKYVTDTLEKVTDEGYATCKVVPAGSVLYVCRGSIGVISINTMDCATNQSICTATCNDGYINEYLYYALKFAEGDIKKQGTGTSFKSLNQSSFAAIELDFPSIDDQKAFAEIARQADKSESAQELVRNINYN